RELAGDAFAELSGWDGKFVATFRTLFRKPGELTRQFIDGRRVAFIAPVRLYLTVSLMYFLAAAAAPVLGPMELGVTAGSINIGVSTDGSPRKAPALAVAEAQAGMLTEADRKAALEDVKKAPPII